MVIILAHDVEEGRCRSLYSKTRKAKLEVVDFLSYLYQEMKLFHYKKSFAFFSFLNSNGMVVKITAAVS